MRGKPITGWRSGYTLAVLTLVYAINMVDRQIVIILQDQIKAEFALSDKQLGLMTGLAFALLYAVCGLLLAPLADRHVRRSIIAGAVTVWSVATACAGLAQSYGQLLLARVGVGVGEAGSGPAAYSMIADMFAEGRRGVPTAIFSSGVYLGILFGFAGGGWMGASLGWRHTLILLGLFGIAVAILVRLTIAEPPRQHSPSTRGAAGNIAIFRVMFENRAFVHLVLGSALYALVGSGSNAFLPPYLMRLHGFGIAQAGFWLGLILGLGGALGSVISGIAADRLGGKEPGRYPLVIGGAMTLALPFYMGTFLAPTGNIALLLYCIPSLLYPMYLTPSLMVAYQIVPPEGRARATALILILYTGIGLGFGPLIVGTLSDILGARMGPGGLRYALAATAFAGGLWSVAHHWLACRAFRASASLTYHK